MSVRSTARIGLRFEPASSATGSGHGPHAGPGDGPHAGLGDGLQAGAPVVEPELIEGLAGAEALGFDVLWIAERPTREDALVPSALLCCAAIAARTKRMHLATGLLPLPLHHPLRVAEDAATLDLVSGGRFELGLGLGSDQGGLEQWGVVREERSQRFAEAVTLVRRVFTGESVTFRGRYFNLEATAVVPAPKTPGGPPLWIGAVRPEGQQLAARLGAGLMLPVGTDPTPYLTASRRDAGEFNGAGRLEGPRLAWLLGEASADAAAAATAVERAAEVSAGVPLDLVLAMPRSGIAGLEALAESAAVIRRLCP